VTAAPWPPGMPAPCRIAGAAADHRARTTSSPTRTVDGRSSCAARVASSVLSIPPSTAVGRSLGVSVAVLSKSAVLASNPPMARAMRMPSTTPVAVPPLDTSTSHGVDPSCSEFRDHVPRSMINESWHNVQRCRSALWNDELVARRAQCRDDPVQCIDGSACGRERPARRDRAGDATGPQKIQRLRPSATSLASASPSEP